MPGRGWRGAPGLDLRALPRPARQGRVCLIALALLLLLASLVVQTSLARRAHAATLTVTWQANTEADLAGYKVFWGTASGVYGAPITLGKVTSYQIADLPVGIRHYVALTAFDTSANESGYSNEASAITLAGAAPLPAGSWWPVYSPRPAAPPVRQPWRGNYSPRPAAPPVRQPWHPVYRKGAE